MKKIISLTVALLMVFSMFAFTGCTTDETSDPADGESNTSEAVSLIDTNGINPTATITVKDYGEIVVELYYNVAPNTVVNFISLANDGFYDGLTFHRVVKGFMIQGGCPKGNGTGYPGYYIPGEFTNNGFENNLLHERGVISMARSSSMDSAGCQFFIMHETSANLDGDYAAFGKVTKGMDVVDEIANCEVEVNALSGENSSPVEDIIIESVVINTNGVNFGEPETII